MQIRVDWMEKWGNDPHFVLEGVEYAKPVALWERQGHFYRRDGDLFVEYFVHNPRNETGFSGATFQGRLKDGSSFNIKGPWSSRPGCINNVWPDRKIVGVECGRLSTAIHAHIFIEWWRTNRPDWGLCWGLRWEGEPTLQPLRDGKLKNERSYRPILEVLS